MKRVLVEVALADVHVVAGVRRVEVEDRARAVVLPDDLLVVAAVDPDVLQARRERLDATAGLGLDAWVEGLKLLPRIFPYEKWVRLQEPVQPLDVVLRARVDEALERGLRRRPRASAGAARSACGSAA